MPSIPLQPGSRIVLDKSDERDPESSIEAYLVEVTASGEFEWHELGWTMPSQDVRYFFWMIQGLAAFHNLPIQNDSGIEYN